MPPPVLVEKTQIIHAYRHLFQHALRAVQFSSPARHVIRERMRRAFRRGNRADFDQKRVNNTIEFLYGAARPKTLESRVLRSLLRTWYWDPTTSAVSPRPRLSKSKGKTAETELAIRAAAHDQFNYTIRMLNESMGMCIR